MPCKYAKATLQTKKVVLCVNAVSSGSTTSDAAEELGKL